MMSGNIVPALLKTGINLYPKTCRTNLKILTWISKLKNIKLPRLLDKYSLEIE